MVLRRISWLLICSWCGLMPAALGAQPQASATAKVASPVTPAESLKHFVIGDDVRIELVAHEPQVVDPVAARFDEDGRLWVVEMRDYPHPPTDGSPPRSKIKLLEDRNGDGHYETAHVFAENLLFATGVQPWKGGILVTLSGKIVYLRDSDGDHRADVSETWFTGFTEENPQLRVNHPRLALDNRLYVASGLRGGNVVNARDPKQPPISIASRDFRFDPHTLRAESIGGSGQFGVTFDDYGRRFVVSNRNPFMHVVLADRYVNRNKLLAIPTLVHDVAAAGELSRVFPLTAAWTTSNLHAGQFTAACGIDYYRGDALPSGYRNNSFTCEPTGNLVHREVVSPAGATFAAKPSFTDREWLASRDDWFRPVNIDAGPDGALYLVDMYRAVIEHPQFMPTELQNRPDLRLGDDRGRIYRIVAKDHVRPNYQLTLSQVATKHLVGLLSHENAWWRETAQRLLFERQDLSIVSGLETLVMEATLPQARSHALWTLQGLNALSERMILLALDDAEPGVREQALVLAETRLNDSSSLRGAVVRRATDADARVRFQAALTLGGLAGRDVEQALAAVALAGAGDTWTRRAVQTGLTDRAGGVLGEILSRLTSTTDSTVETLALVQELAQLIGTRHDTSEVHAMAVALDKQPETVQLFAALGLARGLKLGGMSLSDLAKRSSSSSASIQAWLRAAAQMALQTNQTLPLRLVACELLAHGDYADVGSVLSELARSGDPQELRIRAVNSLAAHRDPSINTLLLQQLSLQTPAVRSALLDALLAQSERIEALLDEIAGGRMKATAIDTTRATRLLKHRDPRIVERARGILAAALPADRAKALADYQESLTLASNAQRGREVFRKNCTTCHRIGDIGVDVGPSIGDTRTKTPEQLLTDILQPNKAIDNNYQSYTVITTDGVTLVGIVTAETGNSVTLKLPEGKVLPLLRSNIDAMQSNGVSLMPEGLERNVTRQEMADVIAFLKNWRYLDGQVPLGAPR